MIIKVTGKAHHKGTSKKTGNPYDFIELHYLGRARGVIGEAAQIFTIDPDMYPYDSITVPGEYLVEFDNRGNPLEFGPVK